MNLIEISNLFNAVTLVHPNFLTYHMGWASDMVRNIANNYDETQQTGTMYPAVLVSPDEIQLNPTDLRTRYTFRVHFIDLQAYDNTTATTTNTKVEQWADLFEYGLQWVREVQNANKNLTKPAYISFNSDTIRGGLMESAGQQRLIYVYMDFELLTSSTCTNLGITYPDDVLSAGGYWPPSGKIDNENIFARSAGMLLDNSGDPLLDGSGEPLLDIDG